MSSRSLVILGVAAALTAGCSAGVKYNSDYDPTADFSDIRTYQWAERTPKGDDDPRVYNDITMRKVKFAVDKALQAKGMQPVNTNPDVYTAWHGAINGKMSLQTISSSYGYGWGWYGPGMGMGTSTTYVNEWDEGTLLVDVISGSTKELIWRGSAQAELSGTQQNPSEGQDQLNQVVARLLAPFPPYKEPAKDDKKKD